MSNLSRRSVLSLGAALGLARCGEHGRPRVGLVVDGLGGRHRLGSRPVAGLGRPGRRPGGIAARQRPGAGGQRRAGVVGEQQRPGAQQPAGRPRHPPAAGQEPARLGRPRQAPARRRLQPAQGHLPVHALRPRQRHHEHGHPARGRVGLLVRGRRQHEGPRGQDLHLRLRPERADRLRAHRPVRGHRQQDAAGARRGAAPAAAVAALAGGHGRRRSRSATATSWSPSTAWAPSCTGSCSNGRSR